MFYKQCNIMRDKTHEIVWLPETMAKIGKILKIKNEDGWCVVEVSEGRTDYAYLKEHERNYLTQREASDI